MASPSDLAESLILGIILFMIGLILLLSVSVQWDIMQPIFASAGMEDVPAAWDTFDDRDSLIDYIYIIAYALFVIAPLQFIIVCVREQTYDQYVYPR